MLHSVHEVQQMVAGDKILTLAGSAPLVPDPHRELDWGEHSLLYG